MRDIVRVLFGAGLLAGVFLQSAAAGAPLFDPSAGAKRFAESSQIERVDLEHGVIVIGDSTRRIASDVRIYDTNGNRLAPQALKRGMHIGFNLARDPQTGVPAVTEILIQPAGKK
jgi:hypothetical protein